MAKIDREVAKGLLRQEGEALSSVAEKNSQGYAAVSRLIGCYRDAIVAKGAQFNRVVMEINSIAGEPQVAQKKLKF